MSKAKISVRSNNLISDEIKINDCAEAVISARSKLFEAR
jgi:hypothetical protein